MSYRVSGRVVKGEGYGRKLGYPTLNLESGETELPPVGVYSGMVILDGINYRAGIAMRPEGKIEAHLIGYSGNAYGKLATIRIGTFLREYKKFETEEALKNQIAEDLKKC